MDGFKKFRKTTNDVKVKGKISNSILELENVFVNEEDSLSMFCEEEQDTISDITKKEIISKIKKKKRPVLACTYS